LQAVGRIEPGLLGKVFGTAAAVVLLWPLPVRADPPETPILGISEIKLGALYHDVPGLWSGFSLEKPAADANFEVLFGPWAYTFGGYLRPAIGATVNFNGDTSKAYADLRWEAETASGVFFALGIGAAFHNGELEPVDSVHKALGSAVLFHPSAEIGYRWDGVNSISIFADHMSNGFTTRYNEGLDTVGIRYGRRFGAIAAPAPVEDVPVANFSGLYVGAFAGYQHEFVDWFAATSISSVQNSAAWGGYAGYNWQSGKGIFGVEIDASPATRAFTAGCDLPGTSCRAEIRGVYSARARFGWVIDNVMIYGTGGVALAPWDSSVLDLATAQKLDRASGVNYGVAVGAGIEYKPFERLGVRAEIMHYGIDGWDLTLPGGATAASQFQSYVGRVGVTWYFH
jgi:lipid A 3-O-deacylase